ncbi:hypothetical protein NXH76_00830 [Blautia schinkii]|nr:hypothetical protein [Blautia schinkii]
MKEFFTSELFRTIFILLLGLVCCFLGYRLQNVWIAIGAFVAAFEVIKRIVAQFTDNSGAIIGCAIVFGLIIAGISFNLYVMGIVLAVCVITVRVANQIISNEWVAIFVGIFVGFFLGMLAVRQNRPLIILLTGLIGGMAVGRYFILLLREIVDINVIEGLPIYAPFILGGAFAVVGILFQFKAAPEGKG